LDMLHRGTMWYVGVASVRQSRAKWHIQIESETVKSDAHVKTNKTALCAWLGETQLHSFGPSWVTIYKGHHDNGRDRLGRLETSYVLVFVSLVLRDHNRKREGRKGSTRRQTIKTAIFKIEIARNPVRDRRANRTRFVTNDKRRTRFVTNDKRKKHM
jgi:hypothetical protein